MMTKPIAPHSAANLQIERRVIRVDGLADQAGIAASLRRAFAAGRVEDCDRDFADLLARLN